MQADWVIVGGGSAGCVGPRIEQRLLDDPGDLRRMRDGVKRCLELLATGAFDATFHHIGIDPTGTASKRCPTTRRSTPG